MHIMELKAVLSWRLGGVGVFFFWVCVCGCCRVGWGWVDEDKAEKTKIQAS